MNFSILADIFFPSACLVCGAATSRMPCCAICRARVVINRENTSAFHAAASYANPVVKKLIHQLKFNFLKSAAEPLGDIIANYVTGCPDLSPLHLAGATIVPIPLSKQRERFRGFNQSALIAERLGMLLGLPVEKALLLRVRHAKPQSETSNAAERERNIAGCFVVCREPPQNIILIDDVVTTGSTFREAAKALRSAGARVIIPIAAARS